MQIRLLCPVEVERDGVLLPLGGAKQKTLLVLLAREYQVVSTDRLVDELWSHSPPSSAINIVQSYVYRLRGILGRRTIVARRPGYLLDVDDEQVDVRRLDRLIARGREARGLGRSDLAAQHFASALELFRGQPLADLRNEQALQDLAMHLDEIHLSLREASIEAQLDCGKENNVVEQLALLTRQYPVREELHRLLMLALARTGRQAEALETYQALANGLAAELGVDPTPALRQLHARILQQDATVLHPSSRDDRATRLTVPLPAPMTSMVGRAREVAELSRLLRDPAPRLTTVVGMGGVGKTRLAIETLSQMARDHDNPRPVWVDLAPVAEVSDVLPTIARALGVAVLDEHDVASQVAKAVNGQAVILALDNLDHIASAGPVIVDLLTKAPRLQVLATSRRPLDVYGERLYRILPLELDEARALLLNRAQSNVVSAQSWATDAATLDFICRAVDQLPLALELVALRLRFQEPRQVVASLLSTTHGDLPRRSAPDDLLGLDGMPDRHHSLDRALRSSYESLDAAQCDAFLRLACFAGTFDASAASAVCGLADATPTVRSLVSSSLLQPVAEQPVRVRMLHVVQDFARCEISPEAWTAARSAHASYTVDLAVGQMPPHPTLWPDPSGAASLDAMADDIGRALVWLRGHDGWGDVGLAASLWPYWHLRGRIGYASRWLQPAITERAIGPKIRGWALVGLAWLSLSRAELEEMRAAGAEAVAVFRAADDKLGLAAALSAQASAAALAGHTSIARNLFGEAEAASRTAEDPITLVQSLVNWADVELNDRHPEEAERLLHAALCSASEPSKDAYEPAIMLNMGFARHAMGDDRAALSRFRAAAAASAAHAHTGFHLALLIGLASVAARQRQYDLAATLGGSAQAVELGSEDRPQPYLREMQTATNQLARAAMTVANFRRAWQTGLELTAAEALALAVEPATRVFE